MKTDKPLISIIIPAYNVGKYIEDCIISATRQTYKNLEIIVINDGSTDNTEKVIDEIAKLDNRIKVIKKLNTGVSDTRNIGINESKGDYLVFLDGDDYLAEDYVTYMLSLIESTGGEMCLSTDCFSNALEKDLNTAKTKVITPEEATVLLLSPKMYVGCWNKIYKKSFIINNEIKFDTKLFYGEGLSFITGVAQRCTKVGIGNKKVYYYRRDNITSATSKFNIEKFINGYDAIKKIEKKLVIKKSSIIGMMNFHKALFCKTAIMKIIEHNKKNEFKEEYTKFKKDLRYLFPNLIFKKYVSIYYKILLTMACTCPRLLVFIDKKRR